MATAQAEFTEPPAERDEVVIRLDHAADATSSSGSELTVRDPSPAPRILPLRTVGNFRDLGGWPVEGGGRTRHGVAYRSAALTELADVDRAVLAGLQLAATIDLRASFEVAREPAADLTHPRAGTPPTAFHVPVLDAGDEGAYARLVREGAGGDLGALYCLQLDRGGAALARAFEIVATRMPSVHHCTTGKDRTGLLSALILGVAGVPDRSVAQEWALSLPVLRRASRHEGPDTAPIERALAHLRSRWGDAVAYLLAHGTTRRAVEAIRAALVEAPMPAGELAPA